jgi:hypothetical protein
MPSLVLVKHDAQRRIEGGRQLVLGNPSGGERIADLVLHGLARKPGGPQQPAVISGAEDRQLRTALQRFLRAPDVALPQCLRDGGIERRHQVFERRLDVRKRPRGFDPNVFDLNASLGNDRIGHYTSN